MNVKKIIQLNLKKKVIQLDFKQSYTKKVKINTHTRHRLRNRCHSPLCTGTSYVTSATHTMHHTCYVTGVHTFHEPTSTTMFLCHIYDITLPPHRTMTTITHLRTN